MTVSGVIEMNMYFKQISTHNLKNIDITIPLNKITSIYGRSGAGKSSLAFSTIYQLCSDEFSAIEEGYIDNYDYRVESYKNLIPAVAITQKNTNNNPRSNLYSYLNVPQLLTAIKMMCSIEIPEYQYLKLHSPLNECKHCHGLGVVDDIDYQKFIDYKLTLRENPFPFWKSKSTTTLYHQLLIAYANQEKIPIDTPFGSLTKADQNKILYTQQSESKIIFNAKHANKSRQRRVFYIGAVVYINNSKGLKVINEQISHKICPDCLGSCINTQRHALQIGSLTFFELLTKPISELLLIIHEEAPKSHLYSVLKAIDDLKLGYLTLSRSIPSLSGGELQKIKFSRLLIANITGVLIVIDEISAQVNPKDYDVLLSFIQKLSKKNTVILVDHTQEFIDIADHKIHIGLEAGINGGYVCDNEIIQPLSNLSPKHKISKFIEFQGLTMNNVSDQNLEIPEKCVTIFTGVSGSGKSSLAKAIERSVDSIYISQKNGNYSVRSILSSSLGLTSLIAEYFGHHLQADSSYFNPLQKGGCIKCKGLGVVKYERGFDKDVHMVCQRCNGSLFDLDNLYIQSKVKGISIVDLYNAEIKTFIDFFTDDASIEKVLKSLELLGLAHLQLNRKTQTLSGGEMRRLRISSQLSRQQETKKILIIDEPAAGLDPETTSKVMDYIYKKSTMFKAVIIIDHKVDVINFVDFEVKLGPGSGPLGGKILQTKIL